MPVTLRDIAERTGVSPSVVSTVLSGRENGTFVSKDTRRRVLEVAQQLNYVPVRSGRPRGSRRIRRMHTQQFIGVWAPGTDAGSLRAILALQAEVTAFTEKERSKSEEEGDTVSLGIRLLADEELPRLDTLGVMGLAIVGDTPLPRAAAVANIPIVQIGEPDHTMRDTMTYHLDSFAGGHMLGEYLWSLGHRSLAFVAPSAKPRVTRHRWQGLQSVWVEHGAPHTACVPAPYDTDKLAGLRDQVDGAIRRLYLPTAQRPAPNPTAVVCFDEAVAAYVLQSLVRHGKRIPADVSVSVFGDGTGGAEAMSPPVTAVGCKMEQLAQAAIHELYSRFEMAAAGTTPKPAAYADPAKRDVKFPCDLIIRDSCAPPPTRQGS